MYNSSYIIDNVLNVYGGNLAISRNLLATAKFAVYREKSQKVAPSRKIANLSFFMINFDSFTFSLSMYDC